MIAGMPCAILKASDTELLCKTSKWDSTVDGFATYPSGHGLGFVKYAADSGMSPMPPIQAAKGIPSRLR